MAFVLGRRGAERGERHRRRRLPHEHASGCEASRPSTHDRDALGEGRSRNWPPRVQRAGLELREERRRERVEADQRVVEEQQRVRLDGPGLGVHAGDRLRVDLVAEIGAVRPCGRGSSCRRTPAASRRPGSGPRAPGATAARNRSAAGSADRTKPPSPSAVARWSTWRRDSSSRRPDSGRRRSATAPKLAILPWISAWATLRRGTLHERPVKLQPLVKCTFVKDVDQTTGEGLVRRRTDSPP